ncbi:Bug family tripartite tricarboxylate transporter substrate binding protein [Ideonella sp. A 288]|uniref:Bug family tripartite tricarboxylate transporter substrate binding protein n=1 Tax=Ideonella sp. A 288 TaxID=1962181 RepID=UPI000B4C148D|nr:Bug family tripartite tricarboxylate transporter substrate binding protein [Ideonella sp. A 288]
MRSLITRLTGVLAACTLAASAQAQVDKPVRLLVGFAPGGSADIAARLIAERVAAELKQPVVVENKPGAGGRIAAEALKNAAPDGATLMLAPIVVPVLAPLVFSKLPYNVATDFTPVVHVANFQFGLSVNANSPAKNVGELLAWFKANPTQANFGSPAPGSLPHFFGVMISGGAGLDLVHVPFNGGGPLMNALVGNQVGSAIDTLVDQIEMHRGGKTRILATSGATRSPLLPDVPTFAEAGLKGVEGTSWFAIYAPAKVSAATVQQINAAVNKALAAPEVRERFGKLGLEPTGGTPADLQALMKRDTDRWAPVVKASGFRGD